MMPLPSPTVDLIPVDADVLDELIAVATTDADADDVTPPLGAGWTPERTAWLRAYHEERRPGFDGGGDEETRAVRLDGRIVGATRLHRNNPEDPGEVECGVWLAKSARGLGLALTVLRLAAVGAAVSGSVRLVARTTAGNEPAVRVLRKAGAEIHRGPAGAVFASIALTDGCGTTTCGR